jgi:hypothetical protein
LIRSGELDDNVPSYHSRKLYRLLNQWNNESLSYSEQSNNGHWFEGVLNDDTVQSFLDNLLGKEEPKVIKQPALPHEFTIVTLNPSSSGSRAGIKILQLTIPFR